MLPPTTESWAPTEDPNDVLHLKLAPGTASGYHRRYAAVRAAGPPGKGTQL